MKRYVAIVHTTNRTIVKEHRANHAWEVLELATQNIKDNEEGLEASEHPISLQTSAVTKVRIYEITGEIREFKVRPL